jgi:hypothetical protein
MSGIDNVEVDRDCVIARIGIGIWVGVGTARAGRLRNGSGRLRSGRGGAGAGDGGGGSRFLRKKIGEYFLLLGGDFGIDMTTTYATRRPGLQPIEAGRSSHNDSGERKESGEHGGEAKQHAEGGGERSAEVS